jgi:predicted Zn-dependent protease
LQQPASSTSVAVTAPPATIVETTTTAPEVIAKTSEARLPKLEKPPQPAPAPKPALSTQAVESAPTPPAAETAAESVEPSADTLYATAMSELQGGDAQQARKTLQRVVQQDPHYAKAHFRMGEIALLNRNLEAAGQQMNRALADSGRLDAREQQLAQLSLAVAARNRFEAERLAADIWQRWPGDPDLVRIHAAFPGMFGEPNRERGRRRLRP